MLGRRARHGKPEIAPARDPMSDTGPLGLRMFNLGTIPASVTPPRTWRRAAWFTIGASAAALAGLLTLGSMLVLPVHPTSNINSMPYFPDGTPLASIGGPAAAERVDHGTPRGSSTGRPSTMADSTAQVRDSAVGTAPQVPNAAAPSTPADPVGKQTTVVGTLPMITALTSAGDPVVDPAKLIKQTRTFFAEVTSNAQAAAQLTTGTVHDDAVALIQQKYGKIAAIRIQSISLDPTSGLTISVLRVVNKDGTTQTQQTTLQFTLSGDPKITNPGG